MTPPTAADAVVHARYLLPMDPPGTVLTDCAVAIRHGRIAAVMPSAQARAGLVAHEVIERPRHALLPGLVNAHGHAAMTLLRGATAGHALDEWLRRVVWPAEARLVDPEFVRIGTTLAVAEMLLGGITCFADMYYFPEVAAQVASRHGIRARLGLPVIDGRSAWGSGLEEHLARGLRLHDELRDDPLLGTLFALHSPSITSDATLARVRALADQLQLPVMIHLLESRAERGREERRHGVGPLQRLERAGLVNELLVAVHCVHARGEELARLGAAGASVVHCPGSNLKLGSGIAPLPEMLRHGVGVALGTDGAASNDSLDLFAECRLAALLASGIGGDPAALPPARALELATLGGARALGLADETGSITHGKWADLTCLELAGPRTEPVHDVAESIVHAGGRACVSDTWVGGRHLVADGRLTRLDLERALEEVRAIAPRVAHCLSTLERA